MSTDISPPKRIDLRAPYRKLIFDRADGVYRGALYHIVRKNGKSYKVRDTAKAKTLSETLYGLFPATDQDVIRKRIMEYVRATEWGRELI